MDRYRGKHHRQTAGQHHSALYALNQVGNITVAWVVVAVRIGYTDNWTSECIVGVAHRLDKSLAQKQRELGVAVTGEALAQTLSHLPFPPLIRSSNLLRDRKST